MKRCLILLIILVSIPASSFASENRVAINDLVVNSNRADPEFVGKGITEMVAIELIKSKSITLVDRKKRTELMEEWSSPSPTWPMRILRSSWAGCWRRIKLYSAISSIWIRSC